MEFICVKTAMLHVYQFADLSGIMIGTQSDNSWKIQIPWFQKLYLTLSHAMVSLSLGLDEPVPRYFCSQEVVILST